MRKAINEETKPKNNRMLAFIFQQMAKCYRYSGNEQRFRAAAYENAAKILYNMKEDIAKYATDIKSLDAISGIGESIAEKIMEYLHKGSIATFEELKRQVPFELLELMDITNFGPATLRILHQQLAINNKEDLICALETGRLHGLHGFGKIKIENMRRVLKLFKGNRRLPYKEAEKTATAFLDELKKIPGVQNAELAGSLRRKAETIGDIDIVLIAEPKNRRRIVNKLIALPQVNKTLMKGATKVSVLLKYKNFQVDIRLVNDYEYGAAMFYSTGPKEYTIHFRKLAKQKGCKMNEYGIFDPTTNQQLAGLTEKSIYDFLGLKYVPPEQRLNKEEMEENGT